MKQENLKIDNYFYTQDLGLATAISLYYPLEAIDRTQNPHKAEFIFKRNKEVDQIVQAYWKGEFKASLLAYFNQLKNIKSRLHAEFLGGRNG
jgi:hypothetical protein